MKWINQAKYFSIICTGRHSDSPLFMYTKDDIDKNPDDVPDDKYEALNENGNKVHYNPDMKEWYNERGEYAFVHKWCKLPLYEEL